MLQRAVTVVGFLLVGIVGVARGDVIFVDDDAAPGGDGASWATAFRFLQDGLAAAEVGDQIWVAAGGYRPDRDEAGNVVAGDRTASFVLLNSVAVYGGLAGDEDPETFDLATRDLVANETVLSGDLADDDDAGGMGENSYHVVRAGGVQASGLLDGVTITAGNADGTQLDQFGGGMLNWGATGVVLMRCTFRENQAVYGAGMYNFGLASPAVVECRFESNLATAEGGGMYNGSQSSPQVVRCRFTQNWADSRGGAVASWNQSNAQFVECTFVNNGTSLRGGALMNNGASPSVAACRFEENSASVGGAISNEDNATTVVSCAFDLNVASQTGGAISCASGCELTLADVRLTGNRAARGGGVFGRNAVVTLYGCKLGRNEAFADGGGVYAENGETRLVDSAVLYNEAERGGGVFGTGGVVTVVNVVLQANVADEVGGALYSQSTEMLLANSVVRANVAGDEAGGVRVAGGNATITNCTLVANHSLISPAGIWIDGAGASLVANCILWANADDDGDASETAQIVVVPTDIVAVDYSCVRGWTGQLPGAGSFAADPLLRMLPNAGADGEWGTLDDSFGDLRLLPASPCIDAGDNSAVAADVFDVDDDGDVSEPVPLDVGGETRFQDDPETVDTGVGEPPIVDLGAYEYQPLTRGDLNCDGMVTFDDIAYFVQALAGESTWQSFYVDRMGELPDCDWLAADCNADGAVDFDDIASLIALLE